LGAPRTGERLKVVRASRYVAGVSQIADGAYDHVVTRGLERRLLQIDQDLIESVP
jgi:hypothetical protein